MSSSRCSLVFALAAALLCFTLLLGEGRPREAVLLRRSQPFSPVKTNTVEELAALVPRPVPVRLPLASSSPPPASSPPPPASSSPPPPCLQLSCAKEHRKLEPAWAKLDPQPRIDWAAGGVRGDCVVGEWEYIMPAYCQPPSVTPRLGKRPSEARLEAADVHTQRLPQAHLREVATLLPNQTLMLIGDSVMEQFYNALQCFMRKEELETRTDASFRAFIDKVRPLWMMGKRKMAPKLPTQATTGMRLLFSRQIRYEPEDVSASLVTANVLVLNWGLHYHKMDEYRQHLEAAFEQLETHAAKPGNAALFMETGAQHFKGTDDRLSGLRRARVAAGSGDWERRDKSTDKHCECSPIEDYGVNKQNGVLHDVLNTGRYPHVRVLPFYELTRPRWRWHFGNCTHRPTGWNWDTCCDCSHFCFSPGMWRAQVHQLKSRLHT